MKKYILFFLLGLVAMAGNSQTVTKIGYTNVELILQYMPETKAIETELSKLEKAISSALEVKQKYYQQKLIEFMEYKQSGKPLSPENARCDRRGCEGRWIHLHPEPSGRSWHPKHPLRQGK